LKTTAHAAPRAQDLRHAKPAHCHWANWLSGKPASKTAIYASSVAWVRHRIHNTYEAYSMELECL